MAKIAQPAIPFKMYRQFAIITLVLTACLALVAGEGSGEGSVDDELSQLEPAPEPQPTPTALQRRSPARSSDFGPERIEGGSFGSPQNIAAQRGAGTTIFAGQNAQGLAGATTGRPMLPGYSQAYLDSLSDEAYDALVQNLQNAGMLSSASRTARINALERASSRRSGQPTRQE